MKLKRGLLIPAVVLLTLPLLLLSWWGVTKLFDSTATSHYQAPTAVNRIVLDTGDVDVDVKQEDVSSVGIDTKSTYFIDKPTVEHQVDGTALQVKADCGSAWTHASCDTDMTVTVPRGVAVTLDGGSGHVVLDGLTGALAIKSGTGDVDGNALLSTDILALSGNGNVDLDLAASPTRLDVSTDNGDIDVVVPTSSYAVQMKSDNGDEALSGITNEADAKRVIRGVSSNGDISIAGS